jgi:hypothetical protein
MDKTVNKHTKVVSDKKMKEKREKQKKCMRKLREAIKNDPQKHEEQKKKERERYHARKKAGKIKSVKEMSKRSQRIVRKSWRERSRRYYEKTRNSKKLLKKICFF